MSKLRHPLYAKSMTRPRYLKLLSQPKKDRPSLELGLTASEVVYDTITSGELLEAIPFVDLVFKALKAKGKRPTNTILTQMMEG